MGAVNWSFLFEDQPWFAGFRDLATNGVNKPVLNVFRMFGMMAPERIAVGGDRGPTTRRASGGGVRGAAHRHQCAGQPGTSAASP
jgi:xylan 1,4-beta-xylosidase